MSNRSLLSNPRLLATAALLRRMDRALLLALGAEPAAADALLASALVEPLGGGWYRLREEAASPGSGANQPSTALDLHTRAFQHLLQRLAVADQRSEADEDECFHHLDQLFFLLVPRGEWQTLARHAEAARAAGPRQTRHRQQLALYDGHLAISLQEYERASAILSALYDEPDLSPFLRTRALNALGQVHWYQARYDRALSCYQQVYALAKQAGLLYYQGVALLNMSQIYSDLDDPWRALDLLQQSLPAFQALHDDLRAAHVQYEIGKNALLLGQWDLARHHLDQARQLYHTLGVEARTIELAWAEGLLYHLTGDVRRSEQAFLQALSLPEPIREAYRSVEMDLWLYLGFLYQTEDRLDEALEAYQRAAALAVQVGRELSLAQIHYRRGTVFERLDRPDQALAAYQQAIAAVEELRGATEIEEIKLGLLGTTQQIYEATVLLLLAAGRHAEAFHYVERARSRAFLDMLNARDPELSQRFDAPVATLQEVQEALPDGAVLLEYFTVGVLPRGEHLINRIPPANVRLREHLALPPQTWLFAVTGGGLQAMRLSLDPNTLRPQPGEPGPGRRLLRDRLLVNLYERLIQPAAHLLAGRSLVYLVPHGPLHYVPFMALRSDAGAHLLERDGPALAIAPSATVLVRNCLGATPAVPEHAEPLLAIGYNDAGHEALHYAEAEARHVARLVGGTAWAGPEPKGRRLFEAGSRVRRLHIAGHAIYNPRDPLASELRLGADDALSARDIIGGLQLGAELVTLSACTSGLSHVVPGDELLGLQRAFLYAGAPTVVCTLWEAADLVALLVMDRFYRAVLAGSPPAAALRDAQVSVREMTGRDLERTIESWRAEDPELIAALEAPPVVPPEHYDTRLYADPYFWAPFMLIGRAG
ncbi:MAG: CHAT domain-containing tetratricopeptide repeat protein [Chloroflexota bacterium]